MATARDLRMSAESRRQSAMDRMMQLGHKRQQEANAWRDEMEEAEAKAQRKNDTNWFGSAGRLGGLGGLLGLATGNPLLGTAIGAGVGGLLGIGKAVGTRKKEGQGTFEALGNTIFDFDPITSGRAIPDLIQGAMPLAMSAAMGGMGGGGIAGSGSAAGATLGTGASAANVGGGGAFGASGASGLMSTQAPYLDLPPLPDFSAAVPTAYPANVVNMGPHF